MYKAITLFLFLFMSSFIAHAEEIDITEIKLCNVDEFKEYRMLSAQSVDLNLDGEPELAIHFQGNNFSEYYFYFQSSCGFESIKTGEGEDFSVLDWASGVYCAPHGCFSILACRGYKDTAIIEVREMLSAGHTKTLQSDSTPDDYDYSSFVFYHTYMYSSGVMRRTSSKKVNMSPSDLEFMNSLSRINSCE